jgi:predicted ester cyclase
MDESAPAAAWDPRSVDTRQLVRAFYDELWNRWDDAAVETVLARDFTFRGSLGRETRGRSEWREYRDLIRAGSSDFHNEVLTLVVDGDQAAARLLYSGTHDGPMAGVAPTGARFTYAGAAFFEVDGGHLTSAWVLGDLASLHGQLRA